MSDHIHLRASVAVEIKRIALEQIDRARAELADPELGCHAAIHQVRKRCKKLRGLLRLCREPIGKHYRRENIRYRDAARGLSPLRDAGALIEAFDHLIGQNPGAFGTRAVAAARRKLELDADRQVVAEIDEGRELESFDRALAAGRRKVEVWAPKVESLDDTLAGLRRNYTRGRRAMRAALANSSTGRFHEWRKRTKYHSYQLKLLENLWKPVLRAHRCEAARLGELLGDEHDLAVLEACLSKDSPSGRSHGGILKLIASRREALRQEVAKSGPRVYVQKPREMIAWFIRLIEQSEA